MTFLSLFIVQQHIKSRSQLLMRCLALEVMACFMFNVQDLEGLQDRNKINDPY